MKKNFFLKRSLSIAGVFVFIFGLNALAAGYVNFDAVKAVVELPQGMIWMVVNFAPSIESLGKIENILGALGKTMLMAVASSCLAAVVAYVFAVFGSRAAGFGRVLPVVVRGIASIFRNIPVVAWAFILLFSFKQSEFTGFFALFLSTYGYLTRCFLESIDETAIGPVEALRATGANYAQIVAQAIVPLTIPAVLSWTMYMIETNIRDATLIGILTGTGIGFVFDIYYKSFHYDQAGLVILTIVVAVIACEAISNYVRRQII